jgi:hypothetical protein
MGYSGLARWVNADADSLAKVEHNIRVNHNGTHVGRWHLSLKSYRSTFGLDPNQPNVGPSSHNNERIMITITNHDVVFVLLEDLVAPLHVEAEQRGGKFTHFRNTLITLRPPGSLENLLVMLKARWMPVRHAAGTAQNSGTISMGAGTGLGMGPTGGGAGPGKGGAGAPHQNNPFAAAELIVEGKVFAIGTDWVVRIGLVKSKDLLKGMLLEAEYLPIPVQQLHNGTRLDGIVSNMLSSILPNMVGAVIFAVTVGPDQWEDVLWDPEEDRKRKEAEAKAKEEAEKRAQGDVGMDATLENDDDVYVYGVEEIPHVPSRDWVGLDRERRSAYMVSGVLKSENLL